MESRQSINTDPTGRSLPHGQPKVSLSRTLAITGRQGEPDDLPGGTRIRDSHVARNRAVLGGPVHCLVRTGLARSAASPAVPIGRNQQTRCDGNGQEDIPHIPLTRQSSDRPCVTHEAGIGHSGDAVQSLSRLRDGEQEKKAAEQNEARYHNGNARVLHRMAHPRGRIEAARIKHPPTHEGEVEARAAGNEQPQDRELTSRALFRAVAPFS
jgi:hypothetical protein